LDSLESAFIGFDNTVKKMNNTLRGAGSSPDISWIRYNSPCGHHDCWDSCLYAKRQFVPGSPGYFEFFCEISESTKCTI